MRERINEYGIFEEVMKKIDLVLEDVLDRPIDQV